MRAALNDTLTAKSIDVLLQIPLVRPKSLIHTHKLRTCLHAGELSLTGGLPASILSHLLQDIYMKSIVPADRVKVDPA